MRIAPIHSNTIDINLIILSFPELSTNIKYELIYHKLTYYKDLLELGSFELLSLESNAVLSSIYS